MEALRMGMGAAGFALFFLNDYNDWRWSSRRLRWCFPLGALLVAAATVWGAAAGLSGRDWTAPRAAAAVGAAVFLWLLADALVFSLPGEEAYASQGEARPVCTRGAYALCRHPGVLWLAGCYACLWQGCGFPWREGVLYSALNLLLVAFEDRCVFPARLEGYGDYQAATPFLLPNQQSISAFLTSGGLRRR